MYSLATAPMKALAVVLALVLAAALAIAGPPPERVFASEGRLQEISGLGGPDQLYGQGGADVVLDGRERVRA